MTFFSLIVCTYRRAQPLKDLLGSVALQTLYPNEILIIDGSDDELTKEMLNELGIKNLRYVKAEPGQRGLTKQRNLGISQISKEVEIVCFLDDDTVLEPDYFERIIETYGKFPDALGVGGYITNESESEFVGEDYVPLPSEYFYDGWKRKDGSRFVVRKFFGLDSDRPPGFSPGFSHGRTVGFLPPSGKIYEVGQLMGGVSSFRTTVFDKISFSEYFEGYGLYEDADFTYRVAKMGKLYCNTNARLAHYHHASGRPNQYQYGRMVVRNGWYVWRTFNPHPTFIERLKWNLITLLLAFIRLSNTFTSGSRKAAFTESMGRLYSWIELFWNKPRHHENHIRNSGDQ